MFSFTPASAETMARYLVIHTLIVINLIWIFFAYLNKSMAISLVHEGGIIQWLQFFILLMASLYCLKVVLANGRVHECRQIKYSFLAFFILTFIVAFEEISWCQGVFGFATPDFMKEINIQNEVTLHNLNFFQRYRHWLLIVFGLTGLSLIYLRQKKRSRLPKWVLFLSPPNFFTFGYGLVLFSGLFLEVAYILFSLPMTIGPISKNIRFWAGRYSEIGELCVAIVALSYAMYNFNKILLKKQVEGFSCISSKKAGSARSTPGLSDG